MKRLLLVLLALAAAGSAWGRTYVIPETAIDKAAVIHEDAPRLSWAGYAGAGGVFDTGNVLISPKSSLLLRFSLSVIPPRQRVTHAELVVPVKAGAGADLRFSVWRLAADWGPGVCWQYRATRPGTNAWARAGARGPGSDRAMAPTAIVPVPKMEELRVNVTEDVELWNTGGAPACGWLLTVEDPGAYVVTGSPIWPGAVAWRLNVTVEPE